MRDTTLSVEPRGRGVAYVVMGFPRLSESFISNEILLLESMGVDLTVYSIKRGDDAQTHDSLQALRAPVHYLPRATSLSGTSLLRWLRENVPAFAAAHGKLFRRRPLRWLATAGAALGMSWRYRRERFGPIRKVFIKEFLQAGWIAAAVGEQAKIGRLHGHFCHGATTITWFVSRLTDLPFSFTAHAKDIYQTEQNPGDLLARKLRAATFVATCTDANRKHLQATFPHEAGHVRTIYHGLDTEFFAPTAVAPKRHDHDAPLILSVGRFVEKKGLRYLVEACALARDAGHRFRCLIVGEDGGELPVIRQLIQQYDLGERIEIRKPVTHRELRDLYAAASMFVLPCLVAGDGDRDGIPNVVAEAMAMTLPVITTPVSGIPEIVLDGSNGKCVPPADAPALAAAIGELLESPDVRARLGTAARATICTCFDARRTTVALQQLFGDEMRPVPAARPEPVCVSVQ